MLSDYGYLSIMDLMSSILQTNDITFCKMSFRHTVV